MTTAEPTTPAGSGTKPSDADRLATLWEAYKVQEADLKDAIAREERLSHDLGSQGRATHERERIISEKDAEIRQMHETIAHKDARIRELEIVEQDAQAIAMYKERISELEAAYAQEKERLAKLFLLYEQATKP